MRGLRLFLPLGASLVAAATIGVGSQPARGALPACAITDLVPALADSTVTQGLKYPRLVRGKSTLVRIYLTQPATCALSNKQSITPTSATLTVTSLGASLGPLATYQPLSGVLTAAMQANAASDPLFALSGAQVNSCLADPCADGSAFTPAFTVTLTYSRKSGTTTQTGLTATFPLTATFEKKTNALRVLVVPMGDASLGVSYSSQFSAAAQTAVQDGMATLSRLYPVPDGTGDLSSTTGGLRYTIDLAAMLNLRAVSGAYDASNKFCGSALNWAAIKAPLAQYLQSWNTANPNAPADRVLGVVDAAISDGAAQGCAEGMASVISSEAWVRAIPAGTTPSMTGALMGMEMSHTFGLVPPGRVYATGTANGYHSLLTATGGAHPTNTTMRSLISPDHTVMHLDSSTSPWNNDVTLLEPADFGDLLCSLGGALTPECGVASTAGTLAAASPNFVISGDTDGVADTAPTGNGPHTHVVNSYYSTAVAVNPLAVDDSSPYRLLQETSGGTVLSDVGIHVSFGITDHNHPDDGGGGAGEASPVGVFSGAFESAGADRIELVKRNGSGAPTVLYRRDRQASPPDVTSFGVPSDTVPAGGSQSFSDSVTTPTVPPNPDIVFLADTTSSMTGSIGDVKSNATSIMNTVLASQPTAHFGAARYKDQCDTTTAYQLGQALTASTSAVQTAIDGWAAQNIPCNTDAPEDFLNALYRATTDSATGWRSGSSRIVVLFGDSSSHDPSGGHSLADVVSAMTGPPKTELVAVGVPGTAGYLYDGLNSKEQASTIVASAGGVVKSAASSTDVASAILSGLTNLDVTVTTSVDCDAGVSGSVTPSEKAVTSGASIDFSETITANEGTGPGRYSCRFSFLENGTVFETVSHSLDVSAPGQTLVTATATSPTPANLRADVFYTCHGTNFVVAVGQTPSETTETTAAFTVNFDSSLACGSDGGGTLYTVVSDGVETSSPTDAAAQIATSSSPKAPFAAVVSPREGTVFAQGATVPLSGIATDPQTGDLHGAALHWTVARDGGGTVAAGDGNALDLGSASWQVGSYSVTLHATGSGGSADATVHFTLADLTPPALTVSHVANRPDGSNTNQPVVVSVHAADGGTGLASVSCTDNGAAVVLSPAGPASAAASFDATFSVSGYGTHLIACTATDVAGNVADSANTSGASDVVHIVYSFGGFLNPVSNPPTVNAGRAGRTYPLKFQLRDSAGALVTSLAAVASVDAARVDCKTGTTADVLVAEATGGTVLRNDGTQYIYNWQTPGTPGCYQANVHLADDTVYSAFFKLS